VKLSIRLRDAVRENQAALLKGTLSLLLVDLVGFVLPYLVKISIDHIDGRPLPGWIPDMWNSISMPYFLLSVCCLYLGVAAFIAYLRYWWRVFFIWSTFPVADRFRRKFFGHIHSLSISFFRNTKVGDLISALSYDTENMRMVLAIGALMAVDATLNFILFPIILWQLNASLTLIVIPPLFGIALLAVLWSNKLSVHYEKVQEITANLSGRAYEIASGIRILKAFRNERNAHHAFVKESESLRDASIHVAKFQSLFAPGLEFALGLALCLVLIFGGLKVLRGEMPVSNLVAFQLYLAHLDWPMMAFGWFIQLYRAGKASEGRIESFVSKESELQRLPELKRLPYDPHFDFRVENVGVHFGDTQRPLFENMNFQISSKSWTGIAGPVGSGKTVLLELLSRQRDPSKGSIFYRGENLKTKLPSEIAEDILYVPQETFLFSRSVRRNLLLGTTEKIEDDLLTELMGDLRLDTEAFRHRGSLDARLGERGVNMSGGQKQRLSLGRALLRKREVYLLDDLFSHVDSETETKLIDVLKRKLKSNSTVVLVSQRLETLKQCSHIIVFDESGFEMAGPTGEILQKSKFLLRLAKIQAELQGESKWA